MIIRKTIENEMLECHRMSALSFNWSLNAGDKTPEEYAAEHRPKEMPAPMPEVYGSWGAFTDDGQMMANLSVPDFQVAFDGQIVPMAGIGGVCTYPHHRRKGAVKGMFRQMMDGLYGEQVPFSYLYPFSEQFYRSFGYGDGCGGIEWTFELRGIPDFSYAGSFELHMPGAPIDDFDRVYGGFAAGLNMMIQRTPKRGHHAANADPFKDNASAVLYRDAAGEPAGYVVFGRRVDPVLGPVLQGAELAFDGFETLRALMAFVKSYRSDYGYFTITMPESMNLDFFCTDFAQTKTTKTIIKRGMVRAVHVEAVLKLARYRGDGALSVFVRDAFLPGNTGRYEIEFADGRAKAVRFAPCESADCDIDMTINAFSSAILGAYDVADFAYMDGVSIHADADLVAKVFYKKPCFINNHF